MHPLLLPSVFGVTPSRSRFGIVTGSTSLVYLCWVVVFFAAPLFHCRVLVCNNHFLHISNVFKTYSCSAFEFSTCLYGCRFLTAENEIKKKHQTQTRWRRVICIFRITHLKGDFFSMRKTEQQIQGVWFSVSVFGHSSEQELFCNGALCWQIVNTSLQSLESPLEYKEMREDEKHPNWQSFLMLLSAHTLILARFSFLSNH